MSVQVNHFTIPVFVPMQGCPFECIFCNQRNIVSQPGLPSDDVIKTKIEDHLNTIPTENTLIEVGFFGGSFTGLPVDDQVRYLGLVQPYLKTKQIAGIRISTRPDLIRPDNLALLAGFGVTTIELGVQSMDDQVLKNSGRAYPTAAVLQAANLIKETGFSLGMQMMIGLPGDSLEKSIETAKQIIAMKAKTIRIYPTLVVRNTRLEALFRQNLFVPLTLIQAVDWCASLVLLFEEAGVNILRLGLHPSEGLLNGESLVTGPFHVAFGEMVYSKIWSDRFATISSEKHDSISVYVNSRQLNCAVGHKGTNKHELLNRFSKVRFAVDNHLEGRSYRVDYH